MMDIEAGIYKGAKHKGKVKNAINDFSGPSNVRHIMNSMRTE